jgi:type IV fimbrial biogenesis protein FimT
LVIKVLPNSTPVIDENMHFITYITADTRRYSVYIRKMMSMMKRQSGLTLVEMMVTLSVLAILLVTATPSFVSYKKDNRRTTYINELVSSLNLARSEATKSNSTVAFCPSSNGTSCAGDNYDAGWIVFRNDNGDQPPAVDAGELILRTHEGTLSPGSSLRATGGIDTGINFQASGRPLSFGDITYCDDRGDSQARSVVVNLVGVIMASDNHADGSALTCP